MKFNLKCPYNQDIKRCKELETYKFCKSVSRKMGIFKDCAKIIIAEEKGKLSLTESNDLEGALSYE